MRHISDDPNIKKADLRKVQKFVAISVFLLVIYFAAWTYFYTIYDGIIVMGLAFLGLVPSFLTNALMPIMSNIPGIKRYPLDGGRMHKDGQRVLGEGKSWNGLIGGTIVGFLLTVLIANYFYPKIAEIAIVNFADGESISKFFNDAEDILFFVGVADNRTQFLIGQFLLCLGAPLGDALGSYYKRRKQVGRGDVFLFWDQNDFIICSIIIAYFFFPLAWYYIVVLLLISPLLTIGANYISYAFLGKKEVPW